MKVAWLSGGASSFVAAYLAKPDRVVYINVANQHPDTLRFIAECAPRLNAPVEVIGDVDYRQSVDEVIERDRYINGPSGARCTKMLKKRVRQEWERSNCDQETVYVWGYDADERRRAERAEAASEFGFEAPLTTHGLAKEDCHELVLRMGIELPVMYRLGYPNNNCIGCVKGGMGYWNRIRRDFPDVFERRARQEREIGHSCIKGVFLDELEPTRGDMSTEVFPACSMACEGLMEGVDA